MRAFPIALVLAIALAAPAWSGLGEHRGFASGYMAGVGPGEEVFGYVRRPNPPFAPPADPATPMLLIGPGTGFAPLRGFLQERAAQRAAGEAVATSLLVFGCRHPDHDWFCRGEMERWREDGVADLLLAFSAVPSHPCCSPMSVTANHPPPRRSRLPAVRPRPRPKPVPNAAPIICRCRASATCCGTWRRLSKTASSRRSSWWRRSIS